MIKTYSPRVTCTCTDKKKFNYPVKYEDAEDTSAIYTLHIDCPFSYEKNCVRHITIQLPPGIKPIKDGELLRN
jgi:hypothetical protein